MSTRQRLSDEQERMRLEGLRILARIIVRHYLAHPEKYPGRGAQELETSRSTPACPQKASGRKGKAHGEAATDVPITREAQPAGRVGAPRPAQHVAKRTGPPDWTKSRSFTLRFQLALS